MISDHAVAAFRRFATGPAFDRATRGGSPPLLTTDFERGGKYGLPYGAYDAEPVDVEKIVRQLREAVPDKSDMEKLISLLTEINPNEAPPKPGQASDRRRLAADQAGAETGFYARFPEARFHKILA